MKVKRRSQEFYYGGVSAVEMMLIVIVMAMLVGIVGMSLIEYLNI